MADSTSTQRTHRYLRLAIGGTVVVIFVSVLVAVPAVGWLASLSEYFYTPARNALVGALIAASLALLALSGRGAERMILDAAALFAPLIALVPTPIGGNSVPGVAVPCTICVPPEYQPDVMNGVTTYLIVLAGILLLVLVLSLTGAVRGALSTLLLGAGVLGVVLVTVLVAPDFFLAWAHFVATVLFFALIAADAIFNAFWRTTIDVPPTWLRIVYVVIAAVIIVDLILLSIATIAAAGTPPNAPSGVFPWILIGEAIALIAFLAFWWLQTWQRWNEVDPQSLLPLPYRLPPLHV